MTVPSTAGIEDHLQRAIFPELEQGRPGWDKPHTLFIGKKTILFGWMQQSIHESGHK